MTSRALVLGAGGLTGIAWETGLLLGLQRSGVYLGSIDLLVGTSSGATVAAQFATGCPLAELYKTQLASPKKSAEIAVEVDLKALNKEYVEARRGAKSRKEARSRIGALALETETASERERRSIISSRLPVKRWPEKPLLITAVDAHSGDPIVFDRGSRVRLVDAVTASCAVPGIWPPVTIDKRRYIDGSTRSNANADLAKGISRILVVTPCRSVEAASGLTAQVKMLRRRSEVEVVLLDRDSKAAVAVDRLNPAHMAEAAKAGLRQGAVLAPFVADLWDV